MSVTNWEAGFPTRLTSKFALLVGVNQYDERGFSTLLYAERDMLALTAELRKLGFQTVLLTGSGKAERKASRANILATLDALLNEVKKTDIVLVAMSGHGMHFPVERTDGSRKEDSFYCPVDAVALRQHEGNDDRRRLAAAGPKRSSVSVVGFALNEKESAAVEQIATAGKGKFYDAKDARELASAVKLLQQEIAVTLTDTPGASDAKASPSLDAPAVLELGSYVSARLEPKLMHYWTIDVTEGEYEIVLDARRPDERRSALIFRAEVGEIDDGKFYGEWEEMVSQNDVRGRAMVRFTPKQPARLIVRVSAGP